MNRILTSLLGVLALLSSCEKHETANKSEEPIFEVSYALQSEEYKTLDSLDRSSVPYLGDFLKLYPNASVTHRPTFNEVFGYSAKTIVYDRYELRFVVPVYLSQDGKQLEGFGEPQCGLREIRSIEEDDGIYISWGDFHEIRKIEKLFLVNGDFSAIGLELIKDQPVKNIDLLHKIHDLDRKN